MNAGRIKRLLKQKESIHLEFKEAAIALPGNLFETICAMLNRDGGEILLGVEDNGNILRLFFFHRYMILVAGRSFTSRYRQARRCIKRGRLFTTVAMTVILKWSRRTGLQK